MKLAVSVAVVAVLIVLAFPVSRATGTSIFHMPSAAVASEFPPGRYMEMIVHEFRGYTSQYVGVLSGVNWVENSRWTPVSDIRDISYFKVTAKDSCHFLSAGGSMYRMVDTELVPDFTFTFDPEEGNCLYFDNCGDRWLFETEDKVHVVERRRDRTFDEVYTYDKLPAYDLLYPAFICKDLIVYYEFETLKVHDVVEGIVQVIPADYPPMTENCVYEIRQIGPTVHDGEWLYVILADKRSMRHLTDGTVLACRLGNKRTIEYDSTIEWREVLLEVGWYLYEVDGVPHVWDLIPVDEEKRGYQTQDLILRDGEAHLVATW